jgi:hypothetical protein
MVFLSKLGSFHLFKTTI